ncbi:uncharacterized protein M421DRAFT_3981 [Didymella exigua CBS 183.55]|uniref:Uncharacterized protein n=1 Tax=Didymella exigua CBS 183.55 TaxID=1150837 RepID=A0A6A5RQA8_9PLEO|nr:uncharacterized protein M421DRAFT_3981 [Didymella exigua CBS 183.55]KAF1929510.1 hypothetical protein M421DRAFT_3981 [Didymella exigua CBS 183.55]
MKVIEKGTDRTAFAHITVEGRVNPLEEYGQYIDVRDKAICCYVAVEEGQKLRIKGSFSGLTLIVAYDCLVDGVCRKANSYAGKSVQVQKSKKLDIESFLYQMPDGVIDTEILVVPYTGKTDLNKEAPETVGTIELRVYITRQFDVEHEIDDGCTYDKIKEAVGSDIQIANYKDVPPQYHIAFKKNCCILEGRKGSAEKKKVHAKRPGKEPWAIFRFHYRTKKSIEANNMDMTFDAADTAPAKQKAHTLELDSVPPLLIGSKPAGKNDGENSVRTSSPASSEAPSTPTKGAKKSQFAQVRERLSSAHCPSVRCPIESINVIPTPKVIVKKKQIKLETTTTSPISEMAPTTNTEPAEAPDMPNEILDDVHSTPRKTKNDAAGDEIVNDEKANNDVPTFQKDGGDEPATGTPKKAAKKAAKKATETVDAELEKSSKEVLKKTVKKADEKKDCDLADLTAPSQAVEISNTPTVPHPADIPSVFDIPTAPTTTTLQASVVPNIKDFVKSGTKGFTSPFKKAVTKPAAIDTTTPTVLQRPAIPPTPTSPLKRAPEDTLTPPPDIKRIKSETVPHLTPTRLPRASAASPCPRSPSMEAQVAEQRKRLEAARKKRDEMAKQKAAVEKRLAPYKQRMAEELERLKQETADEEAEMAADEEEYMASKAMLAEFERGEGGIYVAT